MSIIVNIIFTKTYSVTKRNLSEKTFWIFVHVFTLDEKTILTFRYKLKKKIYIKALMRICENLFIMRIRGRPFNI